MCSFGIDGCRTNTTQHIDLMGNRLKMCRIAALPFPTRVVKF